jgi:hypothetical protein
MLHPVERETMNALHQSLLLFPQPWTYRRPNVARLVALVN